MIQQANLILQLLALLLLVNCDKTERSDDSGSSDSSNGELEVIDGKVRFYLSEDSDGARASMPGVSRSWEESIVYINGISYGVETSDDGSYYIDAQEASSGTYNAVLLTEDSGTWYSESPFDVFLPYSQFWELTAAELDSFPMYAAYSSDTGNKLIFKDAFAVLDVAVSGSADILSVKVENNGDDVIAGSAIYFPSAGHYTMSGDGTKFVVMNCSNYGNFASLDGGTLHFCLLMAPDTYDSGLSITVCDSKRLAIFHETGSITLDPGVITTVSLDWEPDDGLIFYEGFDTFVWGGDPVGGNSGYSPDNTTISPTSAMTRTGYENSLTEVAYNVAGTNFIQSNSWDDVNGYTVETSHIITDSYVHSRNLGDWLCFFRTQEYQGYAAVAVGSGIGRGIIQTPSVENTEYLVPAILSFDFCPTDDYADDLALSVRGCGNITAVYINGIKLDLTSDTYTKSTFTGNGNLVVPLSSLTTASGWQTVTLELEYVTEATKLYIAGNSTSSSIQHGFYIDNIMIRATGTSVLKRGDMRILYWNIQNGMWSDQPNNYENFVEWIQKYDPDVCVWCEASSIYSDYTSTSTTDRYLPDGWPELAQRYGHSYTAIGGFRDNFPQVITSKYPIMTLLQITDTATSGKPVSHGAGLHTITINGTTVHFVTLHLWPQSYGYGVSSSNQDESTNNNEGDYYRLYEMTYILDQTVLNNNYSSIENWLMMGDFNSRSRVDNDTYGYDEDSTKFLTQDYIAGNTNLVDIIYKSYPDIFVPSTSGSSRIDYVYASDAMYEKVTGASIIVDNWTIPVASSYVSSFYDPSDHRPILVDFTF